MTANESLKTELENDVISTAWKIISKLKAENEAYREILIKALKVIILLKKQRQSAVHPAIVEHLANLESCLR